MSKTYNILFLCTGNSARSIMAEAICRQVSKGRFIAYSAGSQPLGYVHPMALEKVASLGMDAAGFRSKNWDGLPRSIPPNWTLLLPSATRLQVRYAQFGLASPFKPTGAFLTLWQSQIPTFKNGSLMIFLVGFADALSLW